MPCSRRSGPAIPLLNIRSPRRIHSLPAGTSYTTRQILDTVERGNRTFRLASEQTREQRSPACPVLPRLVQHRRLGALFAMPVPPGVATVSAVRAVVAICLCAGIFRNRIEQYLYSVEGRRIVGVARKLRPVERREKRVKVIGNRRVPATAAVRKQRPYLLISGVLSLVFKTKHGAQCSPLINTDHTLAPGREDEGYPCVVRCRDEHSNYADGLDTGGAATGWPLFRLWRLSGYDGNPPQAQPLIGQFRRLRRGSI